MVGFVESADILSRLLIGFVDRNSLSHELKRVNHIGDSVQQIRPTCLLLDVFINFLLVTLWNYIPSFGGSYVAVVEGVEPKVFHMPAESGKHHAHIDPGSGHPANILLFLIHYSHNGRRRFI